MRARSSGLTQAWCFCSPNNTHDARARSSGLESLRVREALSFLTMTLSVHLSVIRVAMSHAAVLASLGHPH